MKTYSLKTTEKPLCQFEFTHQLIGMISKKNLKSLEILSQASDISSQGLIIEDAVNVNKLPNFQNGSCYVQDISAQLAAYLISPKKGDYILDACCCTRRKNNSYS